MSEQLQLRRGTAIQVAAFTGAQGEVVVDTTNNRLVVNDGATQGGWAAALATRTAVSDANYTALATDRQVAYTALTAARTVTLPGAATYPAGAKLEVFDESGNCSLSKTITIARAGSDTVSGSPGSTTSVALSGPNSAIALESNGVSQWTILHSRNPSSARTAVSDAAYGALITDRLIAYIAITAPRVVTLPAAAAYPAGALLAIIDESGSVTPTNTITISRAGSDTISGATSAAIVSAYGSLIIESNGANAWTIVDANVPAATRGSAYAIGQSHIPFVLCSSGAMGANGALSSITAVPSPYPNAYVYLPTGAISSGSAAGWYYAQFASTTAATIFNNTYSSGTPQIPASPTAFSTTGPGAFTQTTGSLIAAYTLAIPGNTIGPNGAVRITKTATYNSSSNVKTLEEKFGGTEFGVIVPTTTAVAGMLSGFANRGVANVQAALMAEGMTTTAGAAAPFYGAVDTTQNQNLIEYLELANATDYIVLENVVVEIIPGVP